MSQKGTHTWDIEVAYHRCPACGNIIESRKKFEKQSGKYQKEIICHRCQHSFTVYKDVKNNWMPIIGDPQPREIDWNMEK